MRIVDWCKSRHMKFPSLKEKLYSPASETAFSAFYFRNVTHRYMDTFPLGPVVAVQQVMKLASRFGCLCSNSCFGLFVVVL